MNSGDFWILIPLTLFVVIGWIVHIIVDGMRRNARTRVFTDFYTRLLDRMQSPKDFGEFLQSRGGQRFLDTLSVEKGHPIDRVLFAVQTGLVLLLLGLGLFTAATEVASDNGEHVLKVFGLVSMSLGVGFLLSATASFGITKSLGMLKTVPYDRRDFEQGA